MDGVRERGGEEGARERSEKGKGQEVGVGRRVPGLVGWRRGGGEVGGTTNRELQPTPEKAPPNPDDQLIWDCK